MTALAEMLEEAGKMGATETELATGLRRRLEAAQAWEERATEFLASTKQPLAALEAHLIDLSTLGAGITQFKALIAQCLN